MNTTIIYGSINPECTSHLGLRRFFFSFLKTIASLQAGVLTGWFYKQDVEALVAQVVRLNV